MLATAMGGLLAPAAWAQSGAAERRSAEIAAAQALLESTVATAERVCLSNLSREQRAGISLSLGSLVSSLRAAASLEAKTTVLRGASQQLPALIQRSENVEVRTCMTQHFAQVIGRALEQVERAATSGTWPDPIDFRFHYARNASTNNPRYSEALRLNLRRTNRPPLSRRIVTQDTFNGLPYFQYDVSYPDGSEVIEGTIVPEFRADAQLTAERPAPTRLCLQRPADFPQMRSEYDIFECVEGGTCGPAAMSTRWLQVCPGAPGRQGRPLPWPPFLPVRPAAAQAARARWVVPSLEALTRRGVEGVGYTIFHVTTDAFRGGDALGIEVEVRVNGTPVDEDGLEPELRPVTNQPGQPFGLTFALQTLDLQGANGGCDRIQLGLTPLAPNGRRGRTLAATLVYAPLRDVPERRQRLGDEASLVWTASYVTPSREWRHIAFVRSYIYPMEDRAERERAVARAVADKRWLDDQRLTYRGQTVLGVVRPPRTIQPNGTAAFGLGIGLRQPSGQLRFTFSEGEARQIGDFMVEQRRRLLGGTDVIAPSGFVFQAVGGSRTVPGVCE